MRTADQRNKVVFCWSDISGYMVACWKALSQAGVEVHVFAFERSKETSFDNSIAKGINVQFVERSPSFDQLRLDIIKINPDVLVLCGWFVPAYRKLFSAKSYLKDVKIIMAMDTPWLGTWRQRMGLLLLRKIISQVDCVLTSGERSYQYAKRIKSRRIIKGQYGVDVSKLKETLRFRKEAHWPRKFLFVGRYVEEKGIRQLVEAYKKYFALKPEAWELHACGQGPLKGLLSEEGIKDYGFVQPDDMLKVWSDSGCLIIPSSFDPWPLIVVEACAAGLPVICTHASGSQVEVVKMYWNGLVINENSVEDLFDALCWIHENEKQLPQMGMNSVAQAEPYSAQAWAHRFKESFSSL